MGQAVVIGGAGFLGKAVAQELIRRGRDVTSFDRSECGVDGVRSAVGDIADAHALTEVMAGVDEVYHLAGMLGTTELNDDLRRSVEVNIFGSLNVFEAAIRQRVPRVFNASKVHLWLNAYTVTKHAAEQLGRLLAHQSATRICSLRFLNIYGCGQKLAPVRKVLPTFAAQALRGLPIEVYGNGRQMIDMLYVDDAARLAVDFLESGYVDRALDCGSGVGMTVEALARAVNSFYGNDAGIEHVRMRPGETTTELQAVADMADYRSVVGPFTLSDPDTSLRITLEWYATLDAHEIDAALTFHGLAKPFDGSWRC